MYVFFSFALYIRTTYERPMKPIFSDIPNFWANWADRPKDMHLFGIVSDFSMISIIQFFFYKKLCFSDLTQIYPKYDSSRTEFGK